MIAVVPNLTEPMNAVERADRLKPRIRRALLAWFRRDARDLPWRRTRDPYRIWLSEIMLQQTRVETVVPYYERFTKAFPTLRKLAAAGDDRVLKMWEGLGYYSRARNLHAAARRIVDEYNGKVPKTAAELQRLPGIGRYTANAIASIAFGERAPVVDGNVKRVLARLFDIASSIGEIKTVDLMWEVAEILVAPRAPGNFNQAMMELGARICTPRKPECPYCPLRNCCESKARGNQEQRPVRRKRAPVPHFEIVAAAIQKNGRYLMGKRPAGGLLGGLWEFPGGKVKPGETHEAALTREVREELGIEIEISDRAGSVKHAYSHFTITLHLYRCRHTRGRPKARYHSELKWISRNNFRRHALPAATIRCLPFL